MVFLCMKKNKSRLGFTLAEVLMVVAIIVILFALSVPAVASIQKNLRQKELDTKAETIYTAVQNRLTELYASGQSELFDPSNETYSACIKKLGYMPPDYELDSTIGNDSVYYISNNFNSDDEVLNMLNSNYINELLGDSTLSDDLMNGHWVIEIIPYYYDSENETYSLTAASVYAVYYSEDVIDVSSEYSTSINSVTNPYYRQYRSSKTVRQGLSDSRVGYFSSASLAGGSSTNSLKVSYIKINSNDLVNTAEVWIKKPAIISENAEFKFEFKDDEGNTRTYYFLQTGIDKNAYKLYTLDVNGDKVQVKKEDIGLTYTPSGSIYKFKFTLDDLSKESTRFKSLFGTKIGSSSYTFKALNPGSDITLFVDAYCFLEDNKTIDGSITKEGISYAYGNSLYAYTVSGEEVDSDNKDGLLNEEFAYISNGRHLQNLDSDSNVYSTITKAQLINDISFKTDSDFYEQYNKSYCYGKTTINSISSGGIVSSVSVPKFKPITNANLTNFDASYSNTDGFGRSLNGVHAIYNLGVNYGSNDSGLFGTVSKNFTISNLKLVGTYINGTNNASSLIGSISNNTKVNINNIYVYLDTANGDIPSVISSNDNIESFRFIKANNVGGLVGYNAGELSINSSFASTILGNNNSIAGGLVGNNTGTLTISKSYADSYLYGDSVGGLVGKGSGIINIDNSFSAGFIGLADSGSAAGLVNGTISSLNYAYAATNCYNIADDEGLDRSNNLISSSIYYGIAPKINSYNNSIYYAHGSMNDNAATSVSYGNTLTEGANIGGSFTNTSTLRSVPYKLLGQSLSGYPYPRIEGLEHYGDWDASFSKGALVYYEKYEYYDDNNLITTYGFDGANVDFSILQDHQIVGDGYGFVFIADETNSVPNSFKYTLGSKSYTVNTSSATKYPVTYKGVNYVIFPLDKSVVNPTSLTTYYTNVSMTFDTTTKYFVYNPHFASTVVELTSELSDTDNPTTVSIRSPRQLYNLSLYHDKYYLNLLGSKVTYQQNRNMDYVSYDWSTFTNFGSLVSSQEPIGLPKYRDDKHTNAFSATYDGGYYEINNVSFISKSGEYVGMFGYINQGATVRNVRIVTQYSTTGNNYLVKREKSSDINDHIYIGVLAGLNNGTIDNCAIAGYYLSGSEGIIYGLNNSNFYVGGLVGLNSDKGRITNSSADLPIISINMFQANCYAGGFVGSNEGTINNTYAINHINAVSYGEATSTSIGGFAGYNIGRITNSYCATALTSEGDSTSSYMFAPGGNGGYVNASNTYYLNLGSYWFVDDLYSYNGNSSSDGTAKKFSELQALASDSKAEASYYNQLTVDLIRKNDSDEAANNANYPFRAVVKNNNELVHYGEWQVSPSLGDYGLFYWEHEEGGSNDGYHITYLGNGNKGIMFESTLCNQHNDGGVITEYGYGYYVMQNYEKYVSVSTENINYSGSGISYDNLEDYINKDARDELKNQLPDCTLYPFTTKLSADDSDSSYIYLNSSDINGSITLKYTDDNDHSKDSSHQYYVSPFFGNALSMVVDEDTFKTNLTNKTSVAPYLTTSSSYNRASLSNSVYIPGSSNHSYEIRSITQLQFINWNNKSQSYDKLVGKDANDTTTGYYQNFNYLMYTNIVDKAGEQTANSAENSNNQYLSFKMSHDIYGYDIDNDGKKVDVSNYAPIAGATVSTPTTGVNKYQVTLYAWFGSTFDGGSYKIQDLNIISNSFTVGLFGVTVGAKLNNIILYSSDGKDVIQRGVVNTGDSNPGGSYALGGLVGVAYDYGKDPTDTNNVITNCAIGGYNIIDNSTNTLGFGEANVGGLIGVSNTKIDQCSAVVDIQINCTHSSTNLSPYGNFIRVGGIAGAAPNAISNCYSGGSISVGKDTLKENFTNNGSSLSYYDKDTLKYNSGKANDRYSTHIYLAGIAGSGFAMNYYNFTASSGLKEGYPNVSNSYTYMQFPKMEGTIRSITMITSLADRYQEANASTVKITNCYYLDTSANFETNLPTFTINKGSVSPNSAYSVDNNKYRYRDYYNSNNNITYWQDMINGGSTWLNYVVGGNYDGSYNSVFYKCTGTPTLKTYSELINIKDALNVGSSNIWGYVTTTNSAGTSVSGRYSFPASTSYLLGKDYPFPTVITQSESSRTVNVHYGRWGFDGPYFEEGIATFDILNELNLSENETYAYYYLLLHKNGTNITNLNISSSDTTKVQVTDEIDLVGEDYLIKVKAIDKGSAIITATWDVLGDDGQVTAIEKKETCTVNVTANLVVSLKDGNNEILTNIGDANSIELIASSPNLEKDYSTSNISISTDPVTNGIINWSFVHSENTSINDLKDDPVDLGTYDATNNKYKLYLLGNEGTVDVTAIYLYNGAMLEGHTTINIKRNPMVGLAGQKTLTEDTYTYNEANIDNTTIESTINGEDNLYVIFSEPSGLNRFYLYEYNDDILSTSDINLEAYTIVDGKEQSLDNVKLTLNSNITNADEEGYRYQYIDAVYKNNEPTLLENVYIRATLTDKENNNKYILTLEGVAIDSTPYNVIVDANGGTYEDKSTTKSYPINTSTLISSFVRPTREGYNLLAWSNQTTSAATQDISLESSDNLYDKYKQFSSDVTLYAIWNPYSVQVDFVNNSITDENNKTVTMNVTYDSDSITNPSNAVSRDDAKFNGWFASEDDSNPIINSEGKVVNKDSFNKMIVEAYQNNTSITLYAKYTQYNTITFVGSLGEDTSSYNSSNLVYIKNDETTISSGYATSYTDLSTNITYNLLGWYSSANENGTLVIDSDGNIKDNSIISDGHINLTANLTLFAHWNKQTKEDAYVFDNTYTLQENNQYLIVNSNSKGSYYALSIEVKDSNNFNLITKSVDVLNGDLAINNSSVNSLYIPYTDSLTYSSWKASKGKNTDTFYLGVDNTYYLFLENCGSNGNNCKLKATTKIGETAEEKTLGYWKFVKNEGTFSTYYCLKDQWVQGTRSVDYYVRYDNSFTAVKYNWINNNIYIYKLVEDCLVTNETVYTLPSSILESISTSSLSLDDEEISINNYYIESDDVYDDTFGNNAKVSDVLDIFDSNENDDLTNDEVIDDSSINDSQIDNDVDDEAVDNNEIKSEIIEENDGVDVSNEE